jgi:cytidine deaminase
MLEKKIHKTLIKARDMAIAPYSGFKVGAVIETKDGKFYSGHNIESSSYSLTICAERVALFKALSEGAREFERIYITTSSEEFCTPCGACRQVLYDFAPNLEVVLVTVSGKTKSFELKSLLPEAFSKEQLGK